MANDPRIPTETNLAGFWGAHTAAGALALGSMAFLIALRRVFRNHNGG